MNLPILDMPLCHYLPHLFGGSLLRHYEYTHAHGHPHTEITIGFQSPPDEREIIKALRWHFGAMQLVFIASKFRIMDIWKLSVYQRDTDCSEDIFQYSVYFSLRASADSWMLIISINPKNGF